MYLTNLYGKMYFTKLYLQNISSWWFQLSTYLKIYASQFGSFLQAGVKIQKKYLKPPPRFVKYKPLLQFGCSKNRGTPKWMVYKGKPYQNGWFGGTAIFGNTHFATTKQTKHKKPSASSGSLEIPIPQTPSPEPPWKPRTWKQPNLNDKVFVVYVYLYISGRSGK